MCVNEQCEYDYVPLQDDRGEDMTFEAYYNHVKHGNQNLQMIHAAIPHVRATIVNDMLADDRGRLPYVYRREDLFGFLNGVLSIQIGNVKEPFTLDEDGIVEHGPNLKFVTNEILKEQDIDRFTVRKFFPIEYKEEWTDMDTSWTRDAVTALENSD